jgi:hypothetical protein
MDTVIDISSILPATCDDDTLTITSDSGDSIKFTHLGDWKITGTQMARHGATCINNPITAPAAPTIGTATAGDTQASITFTPNGTGGSAITGFTATSTPGGFTASGASSPLVVTGLTNGTPYTFTVHATNAIGNSAESAASNSVTPAAPAVYATWDTATGVTLSNGNLTAAYGNAKSNLSTIGKSSGVWYWEYKTQSGQGDGGQLNGVAIAASSRSAECGFSVGSLAYSAGNGQKYTASVGTAYGAAYTTETIGVLLDLNNGTALGSVTFYKAGVSQGAITLPSITTWYASSGNNGTTVTANYGATAFDQSVPGGANPGLYS